MARAFPEIFLRFARVCVEAKLHLLTSSKKVWVKLKACENLTPVHKMDCEYAHARLFLHSRRQLGSSRAFAVHLEQTEQFLAGFRLHGVETAAGTQECEPGASASSLTAALLATVDLDASEDWSPEDKMRASQARVVAWLAHSSDVRVRSERVHELAGLFAVVGGEELGVGEALDVVGAVDARARLAADGDAHVFEGHVEAD